MLSVKGVEFWRNMPELLWLSHAAVFWKCSACRLKPDADAALVELFLVDCLESSTGVSEVFLADVWLATVAASDWTKFVSSVIDGSADSTLLWSESRRFFCFLDFGLSVLCCVGLVLTPTLRSVELISD